MYWEYDLTNEGVVTITKNYDYGSCSVDADGCSVGFNVYTIRPLKEGEVTINFRYISGNEHNIIKTATYRILVTADNKIT